MAKSRKRVGAGYAIKVFTDPVTGRRRTQRVNSITSNSGYNSSNNINRMAFAPASIRRSRRNRRNRRNTRRRLH